MKNKESIKLNNTGHGSIMRKLGVSHVKRQIMVFFHPDEGRWFASGYDDDQQIIKTKTGETKLCDMPQSKSVVVFSSSCFEDKDEIMILKDESGKFGVFTMSPHGYYYGSDRGGFDYKTVHLYFDMWTNGLEGSVHYIITEKFDGKWDLVWINCPIRYDKKTHKKEFNLGVNRRWLKKDCDSEQQALVYLRQLGGPRFTDKRRYCLYDLTDDNEQSLYKAPCEIIGDILRVSGFYSLADSNTYLQVEVTMWPTNNIRSAYKVQSNEDLIERIKHDYCLTDDDNPSLGFQERMKQFALNHHLFYRISLSEEVANLED